MAGEGARRVVELRRAGEALGTALKLVAAGAGAAGNPAIRRSLRRAARVAGGAGGIAAAVLGSSLAHAIWAARRHPFLPARPLEIDCVLGPEGGEPLTLAVLGDSSVSGVGAERAEDTIPYGVARSLAGEYRVTLRCFGVSGSRLAHVVSEQLPQLAAIDPDIVLVCVGTNDITHVTPLPEVRRQLRLLATGLKEVAPRAVTVVSGLPAAETALAFRQPLRAALGASARLYTRLYRAELSRHGITVFDAAPLVKHVFSGNREMFSADLFHPSSAGYAYLGKVYGQAVREAFHAARARVRDAGETVGEAIGGRMGRPSASADTA